MVNVVILSAAKDMSFGASESSDSSLRTVSHELSPQSSVLITRPPPQKSLVIRKDTRLSFAPRCISKAGVRWNSKVVTSCRGSAKEGNISLQSKVQFGLYRKTNVVGTSSDTG
jgi:hypothetical protein